MTRDLSQELSAAFDHATLRAATQRLRTGPHWQAANIILTRHDTAREQERISYQRDFQVRLSDARAAVLKERAGRQLIHPSPRGVRQNTAASVEAQAQSRVRRDHAQTLARIDASEAKDLKTLMDRAGLQPKPAQKAGMQRTFRAATQRHRLKP